MGRNRGFTAALVQIQREAERQRNAELAATTRAARMPSVPTVRTSARRPQRRKNASDSMWSLVIDVELLNEELQDDVARLHRLLADTLTVDDFDFETLKEAAPLPIFAPGAPRTQSHLQVPMGSDLRSRQACGSSARCLRKVPCQMG